METAAASNAELKSWKLKNKLYPRLNTVRKKYKKAGQKFDIDLNKLSECLLKQLVDNYEKKNWKVTKDFIHVVFWKCRVASYDDLCDLQQLVEIATDSDDFEKMNVLANSVKRVIKMKKSNPEIANALLGSHGRESQRNKKDSGFEEIKEEGIQEKHPMWFFDKNWQKVTATAENAAPQNGYNDVDNVAADYESLERQDDSKYYNSAVDDDDDDDGDNDDDDDDDDDNDDDEYDDEYDDNGDDDDDDDNNKDPNFKKLSQRDSKANFKSNDWRSTEYHEYEELGQGAKNALEVTTWPNYLNEEPLCASTSDQAVQVKTCCATPDRSTAPEESMYYNVEGFIKVTQSHNQH